MALGMAQGRRLDPRNVARLVDDVLATFAEFGEPGADVAELIEGPMSSPEARLEVTNNSLRRTARRLAAQSPFYARRFASAQVDLQLDVTGLRTIPVTLKQDLIERPEDFRCTDVPAYLATRTTGTTGFPAEVWLSRYEMELWPALGALASAPRGELLPGDIMQVNISSRATAATHLAAASCRLVGSRLASARHRAAGGITGRPGRGGGRSCLPSRLPRRACDRGPARWHGHRRLPAASPRGGW